MKLKQGLVKQAGHALKKATPTILSCLGAIGVVVTVILAVKATPKALERIEDAKEAKNPDDSEKLTRMETMAACWQCYIPATVTGIATIGCIFGANVLNHRQQASLASAYALVSRSYNDYKQKVKEMAGEDVHKQIMKSLAAEKAKNMHVRSCGLINASSLEFEDADEELRLFYDSFSDRYFQATISQVLQAEYHVNRNFALMGGFVPVNMFYEFLGIETKPDLSEFGWWVSDELYWVDFNHSKAMVDDGLNGEIECYIIDMDYTPTTECPD